MPENVWDASQGTNPDTCLHMLANYVDPLNDVWICFSCGSTLSEEYLEEFFWDYVEEAGIYKRRSIKESAAARREEPKQPDVPRVWLEEFIGRAISDAEWTFFSAGYKLGWSNRDVANTGQFEVVDLEVLKSVVDEVNIIDLLNGSDGQLIWKTNDRFHGPDVAAYIYHDRVLDPRQVIVVLRSGVERTQARAYSDN